MIFFKVAGASCPLSPSRQGFAIVVYEYAREKDTTSERVIPRWKTLAEFDPIRTYINARWWMDITDALVKVKVLLPKEPGKVTQTNLAVCKNLTDLVIMATRGQLLPTTPPDWFRVNDSKMPGTVTVGNSWNGWNGRNRLFSPKKRQMPP
jgi:hypothetical protein